MTVPRRALLRLGAGAATAALAPVLRIAAAQPAGPFALPALPYALDANEAAIDARTMEIHHGLHHRAYVNGLNAAVAEYPRIAALRLDQILARFAEMPETIRTAIRNHGGGHANHSMFWAVMGGTGGEPSGELATALTRDFGGTSQFRERFDRAALGVFGSGWAFATVNRFGGIAVVQRPNQDSPLMEGERVLIGNDVWEHAYYLRYQNRRADYVRNWWNVLDWRKIGERYAAAKAGRLTI